MPIVRIFICLVMLQLSFFAAAQQAESGDVWDYRLSQLEELAIKGQRQQVVTKLVEWKSGLSAASCAQRVGWLKFAVNYSEGPLRSEYLGELRGIKSCAELRDKYFVYTVLGAEDYERGRLDSAFYSFSNAFAAAQQLKDTNHMVLSLSNLAALYSELNWKVEALSTALRAYTLGQRSAKIDETTRLFLNNNVAGLKLDLGYYDRARIVLKDYQIEELQTNSEEIHVLRAVNFVRLSIHDARGNLRKVKSALDELELNPSAWVMASSFAVADSMCTPEVRQYIHDEYVRNWAIFERDSATLVSFGLPALGSIAVYQRIDEALRMKASVFREYAERLPLGADRLNYKLAMAQMFQLPDYWVDYWRESERIEQRDIQYAALQNEILREFNHQVGLEDSALRELTASKILIRWLLGCASVLVLSAIALLVWVNLRYKNSLKDYTRLVAENQRLAKDQLVQQTYVEELKLLVRKSGKTLKTDMLEELLVRLERDRPNTGMELPSAFIKQYDLTPTEAKVLVQLAFGYRNAEIAQMLNISKSYIHNVRSKLRQKLPLEDHEELEDYASSLRRAYTPTTPQAG